MFVDSQKIDALTQELAPRWKQTFSIDQIRHILENEKYQAMMERGVNILHLSEVESWNKVFSIAFYDSI